MKELVSAALSVATLMSATSLAEAQSARESADPGKRGGWLMQADLDYGGDNLATVAFTNGESQHVKAGQGISVGLGGFFRPMESVPFEIQGIFGYKFVTTAASDADIKVTRTTLQLNGIYSFANDWYAGGGFTQHMGPELDGDGFFEDVSFDDASGFTIEFGWRWIGLHYTRMDYSSDGFEAVDAGHFGLRLTHRFGVKY